jgi:hypothetical protein
VVEACLNDNEPFLTVQRISDVNAHHMGGAAGITAPRMQVDVFARDGVTRTNIAEGIRQALDGYVGTSGSTAIQKRWTGTWEHPAARLSKNAFWPIGQTQWRRRRMRLRTMYSAPLWILK